MGWMDFALIVLRGGQHLLLILACAVGIKAIIDEIK